jgi:hypothetical protein
MNDTFLMRRIQSLRYLPRDLQRFIERERPLLNPRGESFALNQFHHDATGIIGLLETVDLSDVGMIQRREDLCFAAKTGETIRIACKPGREQLESHVSLQGDVACAKDHTHPAFAQFGRDLIRTDA